MLTIRSFRSHRHTGQPDSSVARTIFRLGWLDVLSALALALLLMVKPALAADGDLEEARFQFSRGDHDKALAALNRIPPHSPDFVSGRLLRGVVLAESGRLDEAITTFELLAREYPDLPQPLNNLAVIYAERGMTEQARATLVRAIELQPRHANAHANLGDLYVHLAVESYARAKELDPNNTAVSAKLSRADDLLNDTPASSSNPEVVAETGPGTDNPPRAEIDRTDETTPPPVPASGRSETGSSPQETIARLFPGVTRKTGQKARPPADSVAADASRPAPATPPTIQSPLTAPEPRFPTTPPAPARATGQPASVPAKATTTHSPGAHDAAGPCLAIGPFKNAKERINASTWLAEQGVQATPFWNERPIGTIYQVYLPPEESESAALARLRALQAKNVRDAVIIRTGVLRLGISLGAFRDEQRALAHIGSLDKRGIDARYRTQNPVHRQRWLLLGSDPDPRSIPSLDQRYPRLDRERHDCDA